MKVLVDVPEDLMGHDAGVWPMEVKNVKGVLTLFLTEREGQYLIQTWVGYGDRTPEEYDNEALSGMIRLFEGYYRDANLHVEFLNLYNSRSGK